MNYRTIKNFISDKEQSELINWVTENKDSYLFRDAGMGGNRITTRYTHKFFSHTESAYNIQRRIIDKLNINSFIFPRTMHGIVVDCAKEDDIVTEHKDPQWWPPRETLHCNLILQKPFGGGIPLIENETIELDEKDLLCYYVSKVNHASTKVVGDKLRIIYSFGFCINYMDL